MYVTEVWNGSTRTVLLRESYREGSKVKNRTLANLTNLPVQMQELLRRAAQEETLVGAGDVFEIERSRHHGHVQAVLGAMKRLGMERLISSTPSRERSVVLSMIAARVLAPKSKLETTRWWNSTTLPSELGVTDADEDELYGAMDWLCERQVRIEDKLAKRHLKAGGLVLYDLSSTYMEGEKCPLAKYGHNRDGKQGKLQVNFGLLTDDEGRPVATRVYDGNVTDAKTVSDQIISIRERFKLDLVIFVGDRGMVTESHIEKFKATATAEGGVEWITALRSGSIRKLQTEGSLQLGLFDEKNLFSLMSPDFPGERLVACRNRDLQKKQGIKRLALIAKTKEEIEKVATAVRAGRVRGKENIGIRLGKVINKYKVAKFFKLDIGHNHLHYRVLADRVTQEALLDGVYVVRTSVPAEVMADDDVVRCYKRLTKVEAAFRSMKMVSLKVRPVFHWSAKRVRAHIFLCMLAYYVEWHLRRVWAPLLFQDEVDSSWTRDAVARAQPSKSAKSKSRTKKTADGLTVQSFSSLLASLSSVVKNWCRRQGGSNGDPIFTMTTRPDPLQSRALQLLSLIPAM